MAADTPTLNRAANQMQSHGVCRFDRDELWDIILESGMGPVQVTPDAAALAIGAHLSAPIQYWGVDANNCFTFREGAPPRMSGRKKMDHLGDAMPYLGWMGGKTKPAKMPPGWRWHDKPDSGDGAPA